VRQRDAADDRAGRRKEQDAVIRVLIVDDHPLFRDGLVSTIASQADMTVVGQASNGREAVNLHRERDPEVTLMDLRMPGMGGLEAIAAIRREQPQAGIIVLTTYDGDEDVYRALREGARGYLLKDMDRDQVLRAIRAVASGKRYIPPDIERRLAERLDSEALTARELEVLELVARGLRNSEIARLLSISEGTTKIHVKRILHKLDVSDRTEAVTIALQRGIIHL
jgi:DNA-binding NarL/FixJ family response regulator